MKRKELNEIKRSHYEQCAIKRKRAYRACCYYECMLIDYAMIEDRLLAILSRVGFVQRVDDSNPGWSSKHRKERKAMLASVDRKYANTSPHIKNISTKIMALRAVCDTDFAGLGFDDAYASWLDKDVRKLFAECGVSSLCDRADEWRASRNTYVHALFGNVSYDTENEELKAFVDEGREIALALNRVGGRMKTAEKKLKRRKAAEHRASRR